jgi:hypothetical protein
MNPEKYCENIVKPTLYMLLDMVNSNNISYEDAQRIGASICDISSCLTKTSAQYTNELDNVFDMFDSSLDKFIMKGEDKYE